MPTRPIQHQVASQAVAAVTEIWAAIGAACEEIRRDYGDDLLVQTCHDGQMDASRIWVQVKGTSGAISAGREDRDRHVRVPLGTAKRWARTSDTVVLVLWNVKASIGWYRVIDPGVVLAHPGGNSDSFTITVHGSSIFDACAARSIAMNARLDHATTHLDSLHRRHVLACNNPDEVEYAEALRESMGVLTLDLALMLGIVRRVPGSDGSFRVTEPFQQALCSELLKMTDALGDTPVEQTAMCSDSVAFYDEALVMALFTMLPPGTEFQESFIHNLAPVLRFAGQADNFVAYMMNVKGPLARQTDHGCEFHTIAGAGTA